MKEILKNSSENITINPFTITSERIYISLKN
jgi:hypothetical protein